MGNTYSQLQEKARLAYEYENCRLFLFYDAHIVLPSPLNLIPTMAYPFLRLWQWLRSKTMLESDKTKLTGKEKPKQFCRHCLLQITADDQEWQSGAAIFCKRCARHGTAMSSSRRQAARLHQVVWQPTAFGLIVSIDVILNGFYAIGNGIYNSWSLLHRKLILERIANELSLPSDYFFTSMRRQDTNNFARTMGGSHSKRRSVRDPLQLAKQAEYGLNQRENLTLMKTTVLSDLLGVSNPKEEIEDFTGTVMGLDSDLA